MNTHLKIFDNKLNWLQSLSNFTSDKALINFVVHLDQVYQGIESYLDISEMPGNLITSIYIDNQNSHNVFLNKIICNAFENMAFFSMSAIAKSDLDDNEYLWNPAKESLKDFCLSHVDKEVIYFEDENYKKTVRFYQDQFRSLLFKD